MNDHPVLLVHGIDDSGKRLKKLKIALIKKGMDPVLTMDILPPDGSIPFESMATQVAERAQNLLQASSVQKLDIVAYSMGTLASRYFIQRLGGHSLVRRFVAIAGPHHGTLTAYLRNNIACRQMRPGSSFLSDLNRGIEPWGNTQVFSFWTILDLMILPSITSYLPQAQNKIFISLAHPLTVSDPWVIKAVCDTLNKG